MKIREAKVFSFGKLQNVTFQFADGINVIYGENEHGKSTLQAFLTDYTAAHPEITVDYIHGEQSLRKLAAQPNTIGFLFDGMRKDELFRTVIYDGALPRKTFSMGHAEDKRYYLECKRIK